MSEQSLGFDGWPNYETKAVALWLDAEFVGHQFWSGRARDVLADRENIQGFLAGSGFSFREVAEKQLADEIEDHMRAGMPLLEPSLYVNLLKSALSRVDWRTIAVRYMNAAPQPTG